jgi:hypothetical protein
MVRANSGHTFGRKSRLTLGLLAVLMAVSSVALSLPMGKAEAWHSGSCQRIHAQARAYGAFANAPWIEVHFGMVSEDGRWYTESHHFPHGGAAAGNTGYYQSFDVYSERMGYGGYVRTIQVFPAYGQGDHWARFACIRAY